MRRVIVALVAAGVLLTAGCKSTPSAAVKLDGSPRVPSDEGIATAVSSSAITLDGRRTYKVSPRLASFSTTDLQTVPLIVRKDQYVQVGVKNRTVTWIAGIAAVVPGRTPTVYYRGRFLRVEKARWVFADGTVLQAAPSLSPPAARASVLVAIHPDAHRVVEVTVQ